MKAGAIPSIFPNTPAYLSSGDGKPRVTTKATSSSRREQQANELDILESSFNAADDVTEISVADLKLKLDAEMTAPSGFTTTFFGESLLIYLLDVNDNMLRIKAHLIVDKARFVSAAIDNNNVTASLFKDILPGSLKRMSQLINVMASLKYWAEDPHTRSVDLQLQCPVSQDVSDSDRC